MCLTEQAQGLRLMKFEEVCGRTVHAVLDQAEAAEIPGVSERTFRRWRGAGPGVAKCVPARVCTARPNCA